MKEEGLYPGFQGYSLNYKFLPNCKGVSNFKTEVVGLSTRHNLVTQN